MSVASAASVLALAAAVVSYWYCGRRVRALDEELARLAQRRRELEGGR